MALPAFDRILFEPKVLDYIGNLPAAVYDCLYPAFAHIKSRKLALALPRGRRQPFLAWACQHTIYASVHTGSNTVVVLGVVPDDDEPDVP